MMCDRACDTGTCAIAAADKEIARGISTDITTIMTKFDGGAKVSRTAA